MDMVALWNDDVPWMTVAARKEDYTPALPFIQEFENPGLKTSTYTIGQYADYVNISDAVIESAVEHVASEMAFKLGQSLNAMIEATMDTGGSDAAFHGKGLAGATDSQASQPSPA